MNKRDFTEDSTVSFSDGLSFTLNVTGDLFSNDTILNHNNSLIHKYKNCIKSFKVLIIKVILITNYKLLLVEEFLIDYRAYYVKFFKFV